MTAAVLPLGEIAPEVLAIVCTVKGTTVTTPDGGQISLDACSWIQTAPCGCLNAITLAVCGDEVLNTAEAAQRSLSDGVARSRRDTALGFRVHLIEHKQYGPVVLPLFKIQCPHTPQWGYSLPTKTVGGVEFSRTRAGEFRAQGWTLVKPGNYWVLRDKDHANPRWLDRLQAKALERAAEIITEATP